MRLLDRPSVYLIGEPMVNLSGMYAYLREVGGLDWFERVFPDVDGVYAEGQPPAAESLVEFMGRLCYKSWVPGLNKNVTRIREDRGDYLLNVLRSGHGSILSHVWFNFVIRGGSRVFTAEMNRHGIGTAISEQSLRYVRLDDIEFWMPSVLKPESLDMMQNCVEGIERYIAQIYEIEGIDDPDFDFDKKKKITSAVRRIAPMGLATEEGWSANVRALRHVIEMRTALGAEEEIRIIVDQIADIVADKAPLLFDDYTHENGPPGQPPVWVSDHRKV